MPSTPHILTTMPHTTNPPQAGERTPVIPLDVVSGTIIGEPMRRVALVAPNGNVQRQAHLYFDQSPQAWANAEKAKLLAEKCGDGKPLSHHASLVSSIYGSGIWQVRIWD